MSITANRPYRESFFTACWKYSSPSLIPSPLSYTFFFLAAYGARATKVKRLVPNESVTARESASEYA